MSHVTEVHAYVYILKELIEKKGWKKEQIYTQNECQNNKLIKEQLDKDTPENIVEISPTRFYVIESKSTRLMLEQAVREAKGYAETLNGSSQIKALFITGIAGNPEEGYISSSQFLHDGKWETITENAAEITGLVSESEISKIQLANNPALKDVEISENEFMRTAEEINGILHENAIHKDARARFISAILLALSKKVELDLSQEPVELVNAINTRVDLVLKREKKADFSRFIQIDLPSSEDNHMKLKNAIVKSIQALLGLNIQSAMLSGKDVLGKFYEAFLKYGNGAKEIGIVLTPRHITRFAVEVLDVQPTDLILDPTCGTGGFLVAAFDEARKKCKTVKDFDNFKNYSLYGIEEQDSVVALAIVNMIFRGDGKNNIIEGNCFAKWLDTKVIDGNVTSDFLKEDKKGRVPPITKILMNPPFPKKKSDKKEYLFIEQALKQMQDGGLLFCVLPYPCLVKSGSYLKWRETLLKENTLLSVITFPDDLFYPIGVHTAGLIVKKGIPHPKESPVFWLRAINDGYIKKKGKRVTSDKVPNDLEDTKAKLRDFIKDQTVIVENKLEMQKACSVDSKDSQVELVPEAYIDQKPPTPEEIEAGMDSLVRETVAFIIRSNKEGDFIKE